MKTNLRDPIAGVASHLRSDRWLTMRLYQNDLTALSRVYDRYGRLVFSLAQQTVPTQTDAIVEEVFLDLWYVSTHALLTPPLLRLVLDLTAMAVMRYGEPGSRAAGTTERDRLLPGLAPFHGLSAQAFEVFVLWCLGRLPLEELAITLEQSPEMIRATLSAGVATLRQDTACEPCGEEQAERDRL